MIVGIHQPNYLPYLGFFDKMRQTDIFVIYDDAQFNKSDFQHRNRIRICHGWKWLTVPVEKKHIGIYQIKIKNDVKIGKQKWSNAHLKEIEANYKDAPYYYDYESLLEKVYKKTYSRLVDLNMNLIHFFMNAFDIDTKVMLSSDFGFTSKSSDRLVDIVKAVGGDTYLSGVAGHDYLNFALFEKNGIIVEFQDFKHPFYQQCYNPFIPNMSAIDALFNIGEIPNIE